MRFGSWVGGDRDGNPSVTAKVTEETMAIQAEHVLLALENATTRIGRSLTVDEATTPPSRALRKRLAVGAADEPVRFAEIAKRSPSEPHRQYLLHLADRIRATRVDGAGRYAEPQELLDDLTVVAESLIAAGDRRLADGELRRLVWQVQTFGVPLASLRGRPHNPQPTASDEMLETVRVLKRIHDPYRVGALPPVL